MGSGAAAGASGNGGQSSDSETSADSIDSRLLSVDPYVASVMFGNGL